jgi:hypothetical protein
MSVFVSFAFGNERLPSPDVVAPDLKTELAPGHESTM